ncbi:anti-FecI sigma factor, FecR [Novosphingobium nitrogenifigens DSM 19370]|uniref:Anti-FecI sigma factor, FecR n=1 Tax=Novosphingobium nitrogenifigens DSM 19370 TaxID=983920 RepID=F1Z9L9_9SPHN|nr:FecR domain-containing protein [Novosphingobium nitrogenifigens]EGD58723.1 anti-FecI sigma factor, FecR [Novosphingobium nitrogenifigens DSM 19370]
MAQDARKYGTTVEAEAAEWAARIDAASSQLPADLQQDLDNWLDAAPAHSGALLRAQAMLHLLNTAEPTPECMAPAEAPVVPSARHHPRHRRALIGGLAGLAASVVAAFLLLSDARTYATDPGELRHVALADGTALTIDAHSKLKVDLDRDKRTVELETGRALFRVAHDVQRPFRVTVDDVTITDVGTVFEVDEDEGKVTVVVGEGIVDVATPTGNARLTAGQKLTFARGSAPMVQALPTDTVERTLAWSNGQLELDGDTLGAAIADMNRRNRVQIRLARPALADEKLYGAFRLDDPQEFARAAALSIAAPVRVEGNDIVIGEK